MDNVKDWSSCFFPVVVWWSRGRRLDGRPCNIFSSKSTSLHISFFYTVNFPGECYILTKNRELHNKIKSHPIHFTSTKTRFTNVKACLNRFVSHFFIINNSSIS